ncbi:MAG: OmpA family protein [Chitinispirillales bacterium]|jgi:outer membrane protein OmpA-like peptidoglycan-associated protein|nr:OmpA family protein [Chitinispirillales bacterium]
MSTKKTKQLAAAMCLLLLTAVATAWAQKKITVPKDFSTIQKALGEAEEGDTVFVRKGVYRENITLTDDVALIGEDMLTTIIDGRRKGPVVVGADGALITGFTIQNGTTGILCKNTRPTIDRNLVIDNKGTGIHALVTLPDITNNIIYRNEWTGIFLEAVRGTRTSISNNVIQENGYSGIFGANRTEVLVRNNVLSGNKQFGIFLGPEARRTRIINNNFYKNRLHYNANADNESVRQINISVSPQFKSPGYPNFDYTLGSSSECRGRGEDGADIGIAALGTKQAPVKTVSPEEQAYAAAAAEAFGGNQGSAASYEAPAQDSFAGVDVPAAITQTVILHGLTFFGSESAEIDEASYPVLDNIYNALVYYPDLKIEIAGHTDNQGADDFNMSLSLSRARSVMNYLVSRGISSDRIRARGYGKERPIESNETADGRAANRRVEVIPR